MIELLARLIAGRALGAQAAVKTHSPPVYLHWERAAGARAELPGEAGAPANPMA